MAGHTPETSFFLGANSAEGFFSLYEQWIDQQAIQAFYVLKGGAGCGKSTLMRRVAKRVEDAGYGLEFIRCSGDPDSLDGIRVPVKGAAMVDGTAPHRMDPAYPGATGHYVDLGAGYDRKALFSLRKDILSAAKDYQACYPKAYRCFRGAVESQRRGSAPLHTPETLERTEKRAASILSREGKQRRGRRGRRLLRFLGGATCKGRLFLGATAAQLCQRGYQIKDECALSALLLRHLERGFLEQGWDVIACPSPERPERLEHLLIPGRSLAFVTGAAPTEEYRGIRTESLVEPGAWKEGRGFLRLSNRVAEELLAEGIEHLSQAKAHHDRLEGLYHPYVDFSLAEEQAERIAGEILSLPDVEGVDPIYDHAGRR